MAVFIWVLSMVASIGLGWCVVELIFRTIPPTNKTNPEPARSRTGRAAVQRKHTAGEASGVLRGGTWIGVLERIAITGALLAGEPSLIAAVVAIKGLGRWADLQAKPDAAERFIIGTLASYVVAGAVGFAGRALLTIVA